MPFGARFGSQHTRFRFWAPAQPQVALQIEGEAAARPMQRSDDGWHGLDCEPLAAGTRYRYQLTDGTLVPDPASRFQPDDVYGPSELIDPCAYRWRDAHWCGRPWHEAAVYELHVGTFTPAGTFRAVIERLEHLATLGVTAIELMPIAEFPGRRNWGYDGVLPFAPDARYGRPDDLKALVDAAHARGLMMLLDVVYNHFGPEGNYTHLYWPQLMTHRHATPWGSAVNYDDAGSAAVREFVIHDALYWLEEFHFDGLRLDAVHAIHDDGARHLLDELAARAAALRPGHPPPLVLENDDNEVRWLPPAGACTAQWNDDVHHGLHVALTGEASGYYAEYREDPSNLPRARGERIAVLAPPHAVRAAGAICLLAPQVPMLFMGEEWGSRRPFLYFCDFREPLASAVRDGRRAEFARFPEFAGAAAGVLPDPIAPETFAASTLDWSELESETADEWLRWTRAVLAVRHARIVPLLAPQRSAEHPSAPADAARSASWQARGRAFRVSWRLRRRRLSLLANLDDAPAADEDVHAWLAKAGTDEVIWREGWPEDPHAPAATLPPWSVSWTIR